MSGKTTNYGLVKPTPEEYYDIEIQNSNMDIIDSEIKVLDNTKENLIKNQPDKMTMADSDSLPLIDSNDGETKKIAFKSFKTSLKTIFASAEDVSKLDSSLTAEITARKNAEALLDKALSGVNANKLDLAGGTLTGAVIAQSNVNYTNRQVHNIMLSTAAPILSSMSDGDIWLTYI